MKKIIALLLLVSSTCFGASSALNFASLRVGVPINSARYHASATSISGSLATISWTTADYDTDSAMSSGTYTCPVAGKYAVKSGVLLTGTIALNNTFIMEIQKNGSVWSRKTVYAPAGLTDLALNIADDVSCIIGDTIRIQVSSSATAPSIVSSNFDNFIDIARIQ